MESCYCDSDEEVFWGPVTAREVEVTWRKMMEEKSEQVDTSSSRNDMEEDKENVGELNDSPTISDETEAIEAKETDADKVESATGIAKLSLEESPKTCFDLLLKSNCLKFIDDESIIEEANETALPMRLNFKEEIISEAKTELMPDIKDSVLSDITDEIISSTSDEISPIESENTASSKRNFSCKRDIILVSDYSIISSDGESGVEELKTYTVLKPLAVNKIDSLLESNNFGQYTPLMQLIKPNKIMEEGTPYSLQNVKNELDTSYSESNDEKPFSDCLKSENKQDISVENPGTSFENWELKSQRIIEMETPGKYSVKSAEQYFDAESDSSITLSDCQLSSLEVQSCTSSSKDNLYLTKDVNIERTNVKPEIDTSTSEIETLENDSPLQPTLQNTLKFQTVSDKVSTVAERVLNSSPMLDFASLNREPLNSPPKLDIDMHYREPEIVNSPVNMVAQKAKNVSKSKQLRMPSKINDTRPVIKPARFHFDSKYCENKVTDVKPLKKEYINPKSNPTTPVAKAQVFKIPTPIPVITPKKPVFSKIPTPNKVTPIKPARSNLYKDIKSPIAGYIRNSPTIINENRTNKNCDRSAVRQVFSKKETPIKKKDERDANAENIDPSTSRVNQRANLSLKPICCFQSGKALIVEKKVNSQLPKIGEAQKAIFLTPQPKLFQHRGTVQSSAFSSNLERKLVYSPRKGNSQDVNELSFASLPMSKDGDTSVLQTFTPT